MRDCLNKIIILIIIFISSELLFPDFIDLTNRYVRVSVDQSTARFILNTLEGNPNNPYDDNVVLLFRKIPPTTLTYIYINGEVFTFGSENGYYVKRPILEEDRISCIWSVKGVKIEQDLSIIKGPSTGIEDTLFIKYIIRNESGGKLSIGLKIILDVTIGENDPNTVGIPGIGSYKNETQLYRDNIPDFWYIFDNYDKPKIKCEGILSGFGNIKPDRLIFSTWSRLVDNPWDMTIDSSREFKDPGSTSYDLAVALQYDPIEVNNEETIFYTTMYGLYGESFFTTRDMQLTINVPVDPKFPPIPVNATFVNKGIVPLDVVQLEILPPEGFSVKKDNEKIYSFSKVNTNQSISVNWDLTCGTVGGTFVVKVKATGILNNTKQSISAEKSFTINYIENPTLKTPQEIPEVPEIKPKISEKKIIEEKKEEIPFKVSIKEEELLEEIRIIDALINDIDKRYQILMGIYKGVFKDDKEILKNIEEELKIFDEYLLKQETILSNQKQQFKK